MKRIFKKLDKIVLIALVLGAVGAFSFTSAEVRQNEVLWGRTAQGWVELGPSNPESNYSCDFAQDICKASYQEGATPMNGESDPGFIRTEEVGVLIPN